MRIFLKQTGIVPKGKKQTDMCEAVASALGINLPIEKRERYEVVLKALSEMKIASISVAEDVPSEKLIKNFYDSWEWARVRFGAIEKFGRRCMCCGSTAADGVRIVVDHVKPVRRFWAMRLDPDNLQILCDPCNMGKGSRHLSDFRG